MVSRLMWPVWDLSHSYHYLNWLMFFSGWRWKKWNLEENKKKERKIFSSQYNTMVWFKFKFFAWNISLSLWVHLWFLLFLITLKAILFTLVFVFLMLNVFDKSEILIFKCAVSGSQYTNISAFSEWKIQLFRFVMIKKCLINDPQQN